MTAVTTDPPQPDAVGTELPPSHREPRPRVERIALWVSVAVALLVPVVASLDLALPGRTLLALAFVLMVPGVPLAALLRVPNRLLSASLAGALSIAVTLLTSTVQVLTGWWHPVVVSAFVGAVSVLAAGWVLEHDAPRAADGTAGTSWAAARSRLTGPALARQLRTRPSSRVVSALLLLLALAAWWLATRTVDLDDAGAFGVIGVVGWSYVLALVLVAAVAAHQLLRPVPDGVVLAAAAVVLALVVYGFSNVADGEAGVSVGWLHVGFIRFITDNHASFVGLDARAYWPGFFAGGAALVGLAGTADASPFLSLAPVFYNVAAIAPLLVIARVLTRSRRLAWLSVFVYLGGNWFQQDYFSPQATALLLYLVTIALLLWTAAEAGTPATTGRWPSRVLQAVRRRPDLPAGISPRRSLGWELALVVLAAAVVVSHQLTPVTLVFALLTFTVIGHTRFRRLWLVVSLCFVGWFVFAGTDYWVGHLGTVLGDLGEPGSNLNSAVGSRVSGDPAYMLMQQVRLGWSLLYGLVGALGWWLIRHRREAPIVAGLVMGSGALVLLGSYGGEVVLRTFVFAAPMLAPLTAVVLAAAYRWLTRSSARRLVPAGRGPVLRLVATTALLLALGLAITTTRGVNIAFERVTADDLAAASAVYERLEPGDEIGTVQATGALGLARVGEFLPLDLSEVACISDDPLAAADPLACALLERPEFVVVSRTQDEVGQLRADESSGWTTEIADTLVERGLYEVIYQGSDAEALQLVGSGG